MKRFFAFLMMVLMVVSVLSFPAHAALPEVMEPNYENTYRTDVQVVFDGEEGTVIASARGKAGTSKIKIYISVYELVDGYQWGDVVGNYKEADSIICIYELPFLARQGTEYKVVVEFFVTRNGVTEYINRENYYTYE